MTGTVVYDEYGHFKNIKDYLCRFVVPFQGIKFNSFQSTSSTIGEFKQTILLNFMSLILITKIWLYRISFSVVDSWKKILALRINFQQSLKTMLILC